MHRLAFASLALAACYTGAPANRDVQQAWRGRMRPEITDRWGPPAQKQGPALVWSYSTTRIELPSASLSVDARPVGATATVEGPGVSGVATVQATGLDVQGGFTPGEIWKTRTEAAAFVDPAGRIADVQGHALHWGPPNDVNLHWGTIFGAHVGMGRLDTTPTPLPSGGAYIGGMVSPTVGLVGTYSLVAGTSDMGSAMGMAAGFAVQYWPANRFWVRGGPALLLAWDPSFDNARLKPGITAGASYAFVKVGVFALDLRLDVNAGPSTTFGTLGVGVNVN